ncbi:hypothetical protein G7Y79_00040g076770 [Physcia stellaris]|nr:hypothetical protein G7Y79_00040g076770 [Physcia stellaris]
MATQETAEAVTSVKAILGYHFTDLSLLIEALQASGPLVRPDSGWLKSEGNKRLALLGDAALRLALLEPWYQGTGDYRYYLKSFNVKRWGSDFWRGSGDHLVSSSACNANLGMIGYRNGLDRFINNIDPGQKGVTANGTMATTVEAIIGAVYLDVANDLDAVRKVMRTLGIGP